MGTLFGKFVHKTMFNFLRDLDVLTSLQSGFIPDDSTVNQHDIYKIPFVKLWVKAKKSMLSFAK